ncbi:hypothetical protein F5Y03DRAFT_356847 [Xylaria venustula]|nr:hypothetical protein F5Y03DRAFT_356847 [Xylaria venustula]
MEGRGFGDENDRKREGKAKGKEKENERENELNDASPLTFAGDPSSHNSTNSRSHHETPLSRLASSAAGLTGLISSRAQAEGAADILPSSKAESSGASQGPQTALRETARVIYTNSPNVQLPLGSTFRSEAGQDRVNSEQGFSEFLGTAQGGIAKLRGSSPTHKISHVEAAAMNDGSDVVNLLETGPALEEDDEAPYMTDDEFSALRRALFEDGSSTGTGWHDILNFVPEFISQDGSDEQRAQHLGVSNAAEARDLWFNQWAHVLSSYTDEVWGDLGPLVTAARQELQNLSSSPEGATAEGLNAVRRLRQILAHIRGPS